MSEGSRKKSDDAATGAPDGAHLGRRLFFFRAATILSGAAISAVGASRRTRAQESDSDTGPNADPSGRGRRGGNGSNSNTDSDWGPNRDPVGGRKKAAAPKSEEGGTDADSGPGADPRGKGRGKK